MDEWFGTLLLLTQVNEGPGDGFPKNSPENLPDIFSPIFELHIDLVETRSTAFTWLN